VRTNISAARRDDGAWRARLVGTDGQTTEVVARAIVNAAGPWVREVLGGALGVNAAPGCAPGERQPYCRSAPI
jgi:glycerol-3-phosphate dehydrogenase